MKREYIHQPLQTDIRSISGHYTWLKEDFLIFNQKRVLYAIGCGIIDSSCCGMGGCSWALVAGFVIHFKCRKNKDGNFISEIETIENDHLKNEIASIIKQKEKVQVVNFL